MCSSHQSSRTRATGVYPPRRARFRAAIFDYPSSPPRWIPLFRLTDCFLLPHTSSGTRKERKRDSKRTRFFVRVSTSPLHNLFPSSHLPQSHPKSAPTNSFFLPNPRNIISASWRLRGSAVAFIRSKQSHQKRRNEARIRFAAPESPFLLQARSIILTKRTHRDNQRPPAALSMKKVLTARFGAAGMPENS